MPETCNFVKKETLAQLFSCEFCQNSKNTFVTEHVRCLLLYLAIFSLQLVDTINNFEVILAAREEEYKKRFVKCFLNIYFRRLEILCSIFSFYRF